MLDSLREDIHAVWERDPAARSFLEVVTCYAGLHAVWGYRLAHWCWDHRLKLAGRIISQITRAWSGVEIHPGARIGKGFFIDHGMGVVIGETAVIGENVTIYHGVTLGGVSLEKGKRHPSLEDDVVVGAGAKVLGNIVIGKSSRIGANAVVVKSVPPNSVVVGVPGQIVQRSQPTSPKPDLHHDNLPDTLGMSLTAMMARLEVLEKELHIHIGDHSPSEEELILRSEEEQCPHLPHAPEGGMWHGEDFLV